MHGAGNFCDVGALFFGNGDVEAEKDCGGGVDGHGSGDFFEGDAIEKSFHVFERIDGDADFADFAESERVVGVHADLRGKIEGHRETGLAFAEEITIALVGFDGAAEAGVLAHGQKRPRYMVGKCRAVWNSPIADGGFGSEAEDRLVCRGGRWEAGKSCEFSLRSAEGLVFVSDIFASILGANQEPGKSRSGHGMPCPYGE